jgi:hypothetical protein
VVLYQPIAVPYCDFVATKTCSHGQICDYVATKPSDPDCPFERRSLLELDELAGKSVRLNGATYPHRNYSERHAAFTIRVTRWEVGGIMTLRLPPSGRSPMTFTIDTGSGGHPDQRAQLTLDPRTAAVIRWKPFSSYNAAAAFGRGFVSFHGRRRRNSGTNDRRGGIRWRGGARLDRPLVRRSAPGAVATARTISAESRQQG